LNYFIFIHDKFPRINRNFYSCVELVEFGNQRDQKIENELL